jgi:phospholipase/carboxylesterase
MDLLPHIEQETRSNPDASVIWLHGLGADGHDFQPIVAQLKLPESMAVRFIFPHAPSLPVTINGGQTMPAWYDITDMSIDRKVNVEQLGHSSAAIKAFIESEISRGIASERIVIAGFSQGGAVALDVALSYPKKLAGLLAMSTYFATKDSIQLNPANSSIPIAIQHGTFDPIVPIALGHDTAERLKEKAYPVEYKDYPMEHSVHPQQINDISLWLQKLFSS